MMDPLPNNQAPHRIACRYRKCKATFGRKTDAHRHEAQVHQPAKIFCKFAGCRFRGTVRAEVMRRHLKFKHLFEVESTFQLDNDNLEGGMPKVKIPRDTSASKHKSDSFMSWTSRLLPIASPSDETHKPEKTLGTHFETGDGDLLGNLIPLDGGEEINFALSHFENEINTQQQNLGHSYIAESHALASMASCDLYVPSWNGYLDCGDQLLGWQLVPSGSKDCQVDGRNTLIDSLILY